MKDFKKPLVSICIPVFNGENYLLECINSALNQNYTNFEILILDNCSTDSTAEISTSINDERVIYIKNNENIGAINNFSKCIDEAKGEYFVLLPHDDLLLPNFVSTYVKQMEEESIGLVYSSVKVINAQGRHLYSRVTHKINCKFSSEEAINDIFENFMPIQLAMVRKSILKQVGGFDRSYGLMVDAQLWLKVFLDGWGCSYLSQPYSCHRTHDMQGQAAFLQFKLEILSDHWGRKLDKEFWKSNSYNVFFLKLMQFIQIELKNKKIKDISIINSMFRIFVRSHLRFLILSATRLNGFILWQEMLLFSPIKKSYGLFRIIKFYPIILLVEIQKKIIQKKRYFINYLNKIF